MAKRKEDVLERILLYKLEELSIRLDTDPELIGELPREQVRQRLHELGVSKKPLPEGIRRLTRREQYTRQSSKTIAAANQRLPLVPRIAALAAGLIVLFELLLTYRTVLLFTNSLGGRILCLVVGGVFIVLINSMIGKIDPSGKRTVVNWLGTISWAVAAIGISTIWLPFSPSQQAAGLHTTAHAVPLSLLEVLLFGAFLIIECLASALRAPIAGSVRKAATILDPGKYKARRIIAARRWCEGARALWIKLGNSLLCGEWRIGAANGVGVMLLLLIFSLGILRHTDLGGQKIRIVALAVDSSQSCPEMSFKDKEIQALLDAVREKSTANAGGVSAVEVLCFDEASWNRSNSGRFEWVSLSDGNDQRSVRNGDFTIPLTNSTFLERELSVFNGSRTALVLTDLEKDCNRGRDDASDKCSVARARLLLAYALIALGETQEPCLTNNRPSEGICCESLHLYSAFLSSERINSPTETATIGPARIRLGGSEGCKDVQCSISDFNQALRVRSLARALNWHAVRGAL